MKNRLLDYNNFLVEGLINTYPISIYKDILLDNLIFLINDNITYNIDIDYINEIFKLNLSNIDFDKLSLVNSYCNNLGYYLTKFKIYKNNRENIIKYNSKTFEMDIKNNDGLILFYESKFGVEINTTNLLYHSTNIKNIEKINKIGLYPKSTSKLEYHYDRIYFFESLSDSVKIIPKLKNFDISTKIKDYIILEICIKNLKQIEINGNISNVKFYKDPKSNGIYTHHNIPKKNIKILYKIYTETDIIDFTNYKINSIKNETYLEFYNNNEIVYQLKRIDLKN